MIMIITCYHMLLTYFEMMMVMMNPYLAYQKNDAGRSCRAGKSNFQIRIKLTC